MTNMFKKSLVALALAGASTGAMAADISATTTTVSNQYLEVTETVTSNAISVTLADEYATDDFLILKFDGDNVVDTSSLNQQFQVAASGVAGGVKGMTIDYVTAGYHAAGDFTWVKFRITELDASAGETTTVGAVVDFGTVTVASADLVGRTAFNVEYTARLSYDNYDPTVTTFDPLDTNDEAPLFEMDDQFAWATGATVEFDGTIDVIDSYRKLFDVDATTTNTGGNANDTDAATFQVADSSGNFTYAVEVVSTDYTVSGDNMFGWVEDTDANTAGIQAGTQLAASFGTACTFTAVDADEVTFNCADPASAAVTLTAVLNNNEIVQYGNFEVSATVNYTQAADASNDALAAPDNSSSYDLSAMALGSWGVNGSITHIPYMPYSAQTVSAQTGLAIDQIIYVTNDTSRDYAGVEPAIYVDVLDQDGSTYTLTNADLGGIKAGKGITKITGQVREALFQAGKLNSSKKLSLTVVVEENPANIEVYSAYNVGGSDRGWVQNDSQRVYQP